MLFAGRGATVYAAALHAAKKNFQWVSNLSGAIKHARVGADT
jgi:hypothetical protein